ncbi:P-type DNA transfer ATPase VirB11 [Ochrobactrum sp. MYb29]|nr:P-type DNA transfer ATPase VirB11 [Ochrobactrum sp. MYb29]
MNQIAQLKPMSGEGGVVTTLLAPLAQFLKDKSLFEIVINNPGEVLTEGMAGWQTHAVQDLTFDRLMSLARTIASYSNQSIDDKNPILSATLPGNERIQVVIPPATPSGTVSITIRKPSSANFSLDELEKKELFSITENIGNCYLRAPGNLALLSATDRSLFTQLKSGKHIEFLRQAVKSRQNILISGATGSGKTTLSKALIAEIPRDERILTIEDTPELVIPHENCVRLYYSKGGQGTARVGAKDLLESGLRMRPDRILLQELRDGTAFYYVRNVNSGHPGSITTVHASSAMLAIEQMTLLVKESEGGQDLARDDIRALLFTLVDVIIQCKRVEGKFRVTEIYFDPFKKLLDGE